MFKKIGAPAEQYYGVRCRACEEILFLHDYDLNSSIILVECNKCGNESTYLPEEIKLYEIVPVPSKSIKVE
jgi:ribosomal protein S27E